MLKKGLLIIILHLVIAQAFANIHFIRIPEIPLIESYEEDITFIKDHLRYIDHFVPDWDYPVDKKELTDQLTLRFYRFESLFQAFPASVELSLLLGDLSHYLYNLDVSDFHSKANFYYEYARHLDPEDYRSYWFQGLHMSQSAQHLPGMEMMLDALEMHSPENMPGEFWGEFIFSSILSGMYWHSLMAYQHFLSLNEGMNPTMEIFIHEIQGKVSPFERELEYPAEKIWNVYETPRGLYHRNGYFGFGVFQAEQWEIFPIGIKEEKTAVILNPPVYEGPSGNIGVSIAVLAFCGNKEQELEDIMKMLMGESSLLDRDGEYMDGRAIRYDLENPAQYPQQGGGRLALVGVTRPSPEILGIGSEVPGALMIQEDGSQYYSLDSLSLHQRADGDIHYVLMLDACYDIFEEANQDFESFLKEGILLE